jgi:hypothetical protein
MERQLPIVRTGRVPSMIPTGVVVSESLPTLAGVISHLSRVIPKAVETLQVLL